MTHPPQPQIVFPCRAIPDDGAASRLLGLYPQIQDGLWMQRVKVLGGALTAGQWGALGRIVAEFTPATPLHLTTRQDVELHDIPAALAAAVQRRLADAELSGVGACGDTLRNITICPCSGVRSGMVDLFPLAWHIRRTLEAAEGIFALPRKFKISLSACPQGCAQPWLNDLGLVADRRAGQWGFRVVAGGSLGARPGLAMLLYDWLAAADVPALAAATVRVFAEHGNRANRNAARLRHARQKMGDEPFAALMRRTVEQVKAERSAAALPALPEPPEPATGLDGRVVLTFPDGNLPPAAVDALARLADRPDLGSSVRIDTHQRVILAAKDEAALRRGIGEFPALADAARPQPSIVACPGGRWCRRALTDTAALADRVRRELADKLPAGTSVRISGCPNNCAQSAVADVGLVGLSVKGQDAYNLLLGGGMGRDNRLAAPAAQRLPVDQILARILQAFAQA